MVSINGRGFLSLDFSSIPDEIHAIQWLNGSGEIEYKVDSEGMKPVNQKIDSLDGFESVIAIWNDAREAMEKPSPPTAEERALSVRSERNARLDEMDKEINRAEDNGDMVVSAKLRKDRQALCDVPEQPGFPDNVVWP